jgi:hypothetical protein
MVNAMAFVPSDSSHEQEQSLRRTSACILKTSVMYHMLEKNFFAKMRLAQHQCSTIVLSFRGC